MFNTLFFDSQFNALTIGTAVVVSSVPVFDSITGKGACDTISFTRFGSKL